MRTGGFSAGLDISARLMKDRARILPRPFLGLVHRDRYKSRRTIGRCGDSGRSSGAAFGTSSRALKAGTTCENWGSSHRAFTRCPASGCQWDCVFIAPQRLSLRISAGDLDCLKRTWHSGGSGPMESSSCEPEAPQLSRRCFKHPLPYRSPRNSMPSTRSTLSSWRPRLLRPLRKRPQSLAGR